MTRKYFGTDGIRGPYGGPIINEAFAARLGFAAAGWCRATRSQSGGARILIGRDTRYSGAALAAALARGLAANGAEPVALGVLPTPAVARAVRAQGATLGAVITASHNPAEDNGIKFFGPLGVKLTDEQEGAIEQQIPTAAGGGAANFEVIDAVGDYLEAMGRIIPPGSLTGWRIVLDTANGATCGTSPRVLRALGAEVIGIGDKPDGRNINAGVGSEHPGQLAARVRAEKARLGIAHDGDGDRCVLCDEHGDILDGDEILAVLALDALQRGTLGRQTLVVTVQSNLGLDALVSANGGRVLRTAVGDRYVSERMLAEGANLGGEQSGHIVCSDISPTGDGLLAALKILQVMSDQNEPLSKLRRLLIKYPQATAAVSVREKKPLEQMTTLAEVIGAIETELGRNGRVLVRWSGTEPKLRLLVEGPSASVVQSGVDRLRRAAEADLGAGGNHEADGVGRRT